MHQHFSQTISVERDFLDARPAASYSKKFHMNRRQSKAASELGDAFQW
jgi:hypothetical protein